MRMKEIENDPFRVDVLLFELTAAATIGFTVFSSGAEEEETSSSSDVDVTDDFGTGEVVCIKILV